MDRDGSIPPDQGATLLSPPREEPVLSLELHTTAGAIAIPTIRTIAADLAARADFDLDSIDDLRMAVDDVCAMLVRIAVLNATLSCWFTVRAERIELAAEVAADGSVDPLPTKSFGWRVLESLTDEVSARFRAGAQGESGRMRITLAKGAVTASQT
ncbi:MAG TPA: ATP-binding protein [Pseudonocardiaceae bacterium]|nr:ATP-binding protein [Pseudonocardiaceae bacterium]